MKRLEMYNSSLVDYHLIMDLVPAIAKLFFLKKLGSVKLSDVQSVNFIFFLLFVITLQFLENFVGSWIAAQISGKSGD